MLSKVTGNFYSNLQFFFSKSFWKYIFGVCLLTMFEIKIKKIFLEDDFSADKILASLIK